MTFDVTQQDVDAFVNSLRARGTPWSNGCADLILKLWAEVVSPTKSTMPDHAEIPPLDEDGRC